MDRLRRLILVGCMVWVGQGWASADDWPTWRGPQQNGICLETGLVESWSLEPRENVAWTSDIGGRATPVILNHRVYLNCRTAHDVNDPQEKIHAREQVVCWSLDTGEILWRRRVQRFSDGHSRAASGGLRCAAIRKRETSTCTPFPGCFAATTPTEISFGNIRWSRNSGKFSATAAGCRIR